MWENGIGCTGIGSHLGRSKYSVRSEIDTMDIGPRGSLVRPRHSRHHTEPRTSDHHKPLRPGAHTLPPLPSRTDGRPGPPPPPPPPPELLPRNGELAPEGGGALRQHVLTKLTGCEMSDL